MTDMLRQAQERQDKIMKMIAQREADIAKLQEELEKLEHFTALGKELFVQNSEAASEQPAKAEAAPSPQPRPQPVEAQQQRPAPAEQQPQAEAPRVMPMRAPQTA